MRRVLSFHLICLLLAARLTAQDAGALLRDGRAVEDADPARAIEVYRQVVAKHGGDVAASAEAHLRMGMCLARLGRADEAKAAIAQATALCPGRPDFRVLADTTLFRLRDGPRRCHRVTLDERCGAKVVAETRGRNSSKGEMDTIRFHSNRGVLVEVRDGAGRRVPFWQQRRHNGIDYMVRLDRPIQPGGEIAYESEWQMERLVVRKDDKLLYRFGPHSPGPEALYEHVLILPPGSALGAASPKPALVRNTATGKVVTWQMEVPEGGAVEIEAEFTIPDVDVFGLTVPDYFEVIRKQTNVITVDREGGAVARSDGVERNDGAVATSVISFSSGPRAKLVKVVDSHGDELSFLTTPMGERTMYMVGLREPLAPGDEHAFQSFYEVEGLVSREGDVWVYRYRHAPGPETFYSHTLRLPADAEIVESTPEADEAIVRDGLRCLSWTSVVASGAYFSCCVRYRLAREK